MTPDQTTTAQVRRRTRHAWAILHVPRRVAWCFMAVDLLAAVAVVLALAWMRPTLPDLGRLALLLALAVLFEEGSRKTGQMRILLSAYLKPDMTSVWFIPAAVVLPLGLSLVFVVYLSGYMWLRHWRHTGGIFHRKVATAASIVLACAVAHATMRFTNEQIARIHPISVLSTSVAIALALLVYTATNRALITSALLLEGIRLRDLVGSWDDNLLEVATLCLGGFVAITMLDQPVLGVFVIIPMVLLQRGAVVRQLEIAASTDSKTGLLNAVAFEQLAQRDLARAVRDGEPLSVLLIDVDRFKLVNDIHGHLAGDVVLKAIGLALTNELRGYDTVGRFGGEEFVACLPNAGEDAALRIAERMRARVNEMRVSDLVTVADPSKDRLLAVSIGVACAPVDGTELTELLHEADAALYRAKGGGRNRVMLPARTAAAEKGSAAAAALRSA